MAGPGRVRVTKARTPYRVDVFPGTHTSIVLAGIPNGKIVSNNPNVTSSDDDLTWLAAETQNSPRSIHFHVKADHGRAVDTTLFLLDSETSGTRAIFQVRRVPFPPWNRVKRGRLFVSLNGLSISLNQVDPEISPYMLDINIPIPNSTPHGTALDRALEAANGRTIDHLIVNAHGHSIRGRAEIDLGDHFHPGNLESWNRLKGRVRYIWFQNCVVGFDVELLHGIAERTEAWVSAPANFEIESFTNTRGKIDLYPMIHKHFNAMIPRQSSETIGDLPKGSVIFFRHARSEAQPNLNRSVAFLLDSPDR